MNAGYYNVEAVQSQGVSSPDRAHSERVRVYDRLIFKIAPNIRTKGEDDYMKQYAQGFLVSYADYWVTPEFARDSANWN